MAHTPSTILFRQMRVMKAFSKFRSGYSLLEMDGKWPGLPTEESRDLFQKSGEDG